VTRQLGIPVTTPLRTLIDLATVVERDEMERAINQADASNLIRADSLREQLEQEDGPGVPLVRDVLDRDTFALTDSELERRFLPIARRAGLPKPRTQAMVNGYRVDFYWPELELVVEVDGLRYHRTPQQQAQDLLRDHAHQEAGLTRCRFTYAQVAREPERVEAVLSTRSAPPAAAPPSPGRPSGSRRRS
jgi:very-short-patch-repair endonuclease